MSKTISYPEQGTWKKGNAMKQIGKKKPTVKKPPVKNAASGQFGQAFGQIFDRVKKKKKK